VTSCDPTGQAPGQDGRRGPHENRWSSACPDQRQIALELRRHRAGSGPAGVIAARFAATAQDPCPSCCRRNLEPRPLARHCQHDDIDAAAGELGASGRRGDRGPSRSASSSLPGSSGAGQPPARSSPSAAITASRAASATIWCTREGESPIAVARVRIEIPSARAETIARVRSRSACSSRHAARETRASTRRSRRAAAIRSLIVTRPACQPRSGNWTP